MAPTLQAAQRARSKYALQFAQEEFLAMCKERFEGGRVLGNEDLHVLDQMAREIFLHHQKMEAFYLALSVAQEDRRHGRYLPATQAAMELDSLDHALTTEAYLVLREAVNEEYAPANGAAERALEAAE
jgi:hypothetical protein